MKSEGECELDGMDTVIVYFARPNIDLIVTRRCSVGCVLRVFLWSPLLYESVAGSIAQYASRKSNVPMSAPPVNSTKEQNVAVAWNQKVCFISRPEECTAKFEA
jgi:hypothetical protein